MLLPDYKAIFLHIPKTAGSSIKKAFFGRYVADHSHASYAKKKYPREWEKYFKFSFVRNPWDRISSIYHFYKYYNHKVNEKFKKTITHVDFERFCQLLCCDKLEEPFTWLQTFHHTDKLGLQYNWISINDEIVVDYVGRFETLTDDFNFLSQKFGVKSPLAHLKRSTNINYREEYTLISRDLIAEKFKKDIEKFDYDF